MRKPIFIIKVPNNLNRDVFEKIQEQANDKLGNDYYVLLVSANIEDFDFQCFSDEKIEPIELDELKELLK